MRRQLRYSRATNEPLAENGAHQLAARHALCHYPSNSIFTFIPKNGCSTLRLSLAIGNGCIPNASGHVWIHNNNATFSATLRELVTADFTCVVLRDPLARLSSVYLDKIVNREREFWFFNDITGRCYHPDEITFRIFVERVTEPALVRSDIHWRPQIDFLVYDDYDLWADLERLGQAKDHIEERTGLKIEDARQLTLHGTDKFEVLSDRCYADVPPSEIRQMNRERKTPSHTVMYDPSLQTIAYRAYAQDIELYESRFSQLASIAR